jgi:hypothetical protein
MKARYFAGIACGVLLLALAGAARAGYVNLSWSQRMLAILAGIIVCCVSLIVGLFSMSRVRRY